MNYEQSELEIVGRLAPMTTGGNVIVSPIPEILEDLKPVIKKPLIWVSYNGTTYKFPNSTSSASSNATLSFEIIVQSRLLRGAQGCYTLMEAIKLLLVGFIPNGLQMLYLTDEELLKLDDKGTWNFRQLYSCQALQVQASGTALDVILREINTPVTASVGIDLPEDY
jgi:hypothetical protein